MTDLDKEEIDKLNKEATEYLASNRYYHYIATIQRLLARLELRRLGLHVKPLE